MRGQGWHQTECSVRSATFPLYKGSSVCWALSRGFWCYAIFLLMNQGSIIISSSSFYLLKNVFIYLFYCLLFKYSFLPFPLTPAQPPSPPHLPLVSTPPHYCPCVLYNCSCKPFTLFPLNSLRSPLCPLSACSQFQCLCLYFACLFILLIRFLLKMRSYRICPSPPG